MDQKQLSNIVAEVYKSLTPSRLEITKLTAEMATIRVVSASFKGMGVSARITLLADLFETSENKVFNERIYILEGFTPEEFLNLPTDDSEENGTEKAVANQKKSALEPNA